MEKPFSYPVYQQAKRLYSQSKIKDFRVNNNIVNANVLDGGSNNVKLVFNMSGQLTSKKCDCSYSKFYHECKHMAAVYMKVKDENALSQGPVKLRDIYNAYVGNKARPLEKNYSDFEYKCKQALNKFRLNEQLENIFSYCFEFSNIIYPNHRKEIIIMYIQDILNDLRIKHSLKIDEWMKQCLIDDKNDYLHDYFLNCFKSSDSQVFIELLENEKVQLNNELCNKLVLLIYETSNLNIRDFINQYFFINNEAIFYLSAKDLCDQNQYEKVIKLYGEFCNKYPYSSLKSKMVELYQKALLGNDPKRYVDRYIEKINYWTKDFSELNNVKKIVGEEWTNIRYDAYEKIRDCIPESTFRELIVDQNEWEIALGYIYENPNYENIQAYLDLVIKNDEYSGYSAYFEYVMDIAERTFYGRENYIVNLLKDFYVRYHNKEVLNYMIFYLRQFFKDEEELLSALDSLEVYYED